MEPINETAIISDSETAREKFEQGRLSRRAALRKIGMTSGMAFFGLFAVDDLARMAIRQMEQHKETRQIAETVAKELKDSSIAVASPAPSNNGNPCVPGVPSYPQGPLSNQHIGQDCKSNPNYFCAGATTFEACVAAACYVYNQGNPTAIVTCAGTVISPSS